MEVARIAPLAGTNDSAEVLARAHASDRAPQAAGELFPAKNQGGSEHEETIASDDAFGRPSGPYLVRSGAAKDTAAGTGGPEQARRDCTQCHQAVPGCRESYRRWIQSSLRLRQRFRPWRHGHSLRQW